MSIPTLGSITLYGASTISVEKNANIIPLPMPTEDSDQTEVFDMLGVTKTLSIVGDYSAGSIASTKTWVDSIESLAGGNQTTISFTSEQTGTISCMVASVRTSWDIPGFKVTYDIKIIQGTS